MSTQVAEETAVFTLIGPPNSGKTSLFNLFCGKNFKTVNYPGSTVEFLRSNLSPKFNLKADVYDSPGIISLEPASPDEKVAVDILFSFCNSVSPQIIINTVDASQLSRHLLLTKQLISSGFRVIVALTMKDILNRNNIDVSESKLSELLGCDVVCVDGRTGDGLSALLKSINCGLVELRNNGNINSKPILKSFSKSDVINYFNEIEKITANVATKIQSVAKPDLINANRQLKIITNHSDESFNMLDDLTLRIDRLLLHRIWGIFFFALIMGIIFTSIFWLAQPLMNLVDQLFIGLNNLVTSNLSSGWFASLISDGIITGTGAVMVFVPQIIILFIILGLLEDTGYLARGAMLIDKPLSKIGLNGRSFVPLLSGFACAIPAMMAARTIPNKKERLLTIFIIPLMSCSARLPVFALLIAFLIPFDKPWIGGFLLAAIYIFSIASSLIIAAVVNKFSKSMIKSEDSSSFILELPSYRLPKIHNVIRHTYQSSKQYVLRAGPIILLFSLILWLLTYFPDYNPQVNGDNLSPVEIESLQNAARFENSYASQLGKLIQPVMTPIGMDWRVGVSLISAFAAREVFVSSLALIFKVTDNDEDLSASLLNSMQNAVVAESNQKLFTPATIVGLIVFFIFALQCLSTVAIARKETGGWRIPILQLVLFSTIAYAAALVTVNGLRFLGIE